MNTHKKQRFFSPVTYLLLLVYTLIILGSVYLLATDDYSHMLAMSYRKGEYLSSSSEVASEVDNNGNNNNNSTSAVGRVSLTAYLAHYLMALSTPHHDHTGANGGVIQNNSNHTGLRDSRPHVSHPFADTRMRLQVVKPALKEAHKKLVKNPLRTATFVGAVFAITWIIMRIMMRWMLDHLVSRFNLDSSSRFGFLSTMLGIDSTKGGIHSVMRVIEFEQSSQHQQNTSSVGKENREQQQEEVVEEKKNVVGALSNPEVAQHMKSHRIPPYKVYSLLSRKDGKTRRRKLDKATNYVSSTVFDSSSPLYVALLSFLYGGAVYLSQKMQVWCLAVALVQLISFNTGKSFWPLIIFTVFIAITFAIKEMNSWKSDQKKNSNRVRLASPVSENKSAGSDGFIERGKLRPGDRIEIRVGEQVPADVIIVGVRVDNREQQPKRMLFFLDEVQVTGENTPVRKIPFTCPDGSAIQKVEVEDLSLYKVKVNDRFIVDQHNIAFASSFLESELKDLVLTCIVVWVGTETKALNSSASSDQMKSRYRKATPFDDYSGMGFLVSVFVLLGISLFNSLVSYYQETDYVHDVHFGTVFVSHLMYLNMIVPQALEQCRVWVCSVLATKFRAEIKGCNKSAGLDVLGFIDRIVSDKTGTLTQNKMLARVSMIFKDSKDLSHIPEPLIMFNDDDNGNIEDSNTRQFRALFSNQEFQKEFEDNALAVFSTTGTDPEEQAIRRNISAYATLSVFEPPESNDRTPGDIVFTKRADSTDRHLTIHVNFGFWRPLLCKSSMFEDLQTGNCYISVQSGGDEQWHARERVRTSVAAKLEVWDEREKSFPKYPGAPRAWSHGLKAISREDMETIKHKWHETFDIQDSEKRTAEQLEIVKSALEDVELISKTFMIDEYRTHVDKAIERLVKAGKQVFMCTGDSRSAAATIALQLNFSPNCIDIGGSSELELLESLQFAEQASSGVSSTFFIDQQCMELLQQIEKREGGFHGEVFDRLLPLLARRQPKKPERFLHFAVFYRATPGLKPFVVRMLQFRYPSNLVESVVTKRHHVLAVGDGANDVNMFGVADASVGILSGETLDVVDRATLWTTEWYPVVKLLLEDGPEKATLLSTMIKMIFLKHWLTAFALWADLLLSGFTLMPLEPTNPMMMLLFNAVIFMQIATHAARDKLDPSRLRRVNLMSNRAFVRWIASAAIAGFSVCWAVRWLFPAASDNQFGSMILVGQSFAITMYVFLSTNSWSDSSSPSSTVLPSSPLEVYDEVLAREDDSTTKRDVMNSRSPKGAVLTVIVGLLCTTISLVGSLYFVQNTSDGLMRFIGVAAILTAGAYPSLGFYAILNRDLRFLFELRRLKTMGNMGNIMESLIEFAHTKHGRILPILLFSLVLKLVSGISLVALLCIAFLVSLSSVVIFLIFVSRVGFLRALLDGRAAAVAIISFAIGVYVGKGL